MKELNDTNNQQLTYWTYVYNIASKYNLLANHDVHQLLFSLNQKIQHHDNDIEYNDVRTVVEMIQKSNRIDTVPFFDAEFYVEIDILNITNTKKIHLTIVSSKDLNPLSKISNIKNKIDNTVAVIPLESWIDCQLSIANLMIELKHKYEVIHNLYELDKAA